MKFVEFMDGNFMSEIVQGLILVDFWVFWCGFCCIIVLVIEEFVGQYEGCVKVVKVNVDDNFVISGQFCVMSIFIMILFKDGQLVEGMVGVQFKWVFELVFDKYFGVVVN